MIDTCNSSNSLLNRNPVSEPKLPLCLAFLHSNLFHGGMLSVRLEFRALLLNHISLYAI